MVQEIEIPIQKNMTIKYYLNKSLPDLEQHGNWIDLHTAQEQYSTDGLVLIPLGLRMKIPKGYEAIIIPRSSTYKKYGIVQANSVGLIDTEYCGVNDEWKFPGIWINSNKTIPKHTRICQFRIQLSQDATFLQKLNWLRSKPKFERVDVWYGKDRGGFGSSG